MISPAVVTMLQANAVTGCTYVVAACCKPMAVVTRTLAGQSL